MQGSKIKDVAGWQLPLIIVGTREVGAGWVHSWWDEDGKAAGLVGASPGWELRGSGLGW